MYNYETYKESERSTSNYVNQKSMPRVGYFKLEDDGDVAIARINCASLDDLKFNTVHTLATPRMQFKIMDVTCLESPGSGVKCPLCEASASGNTAVSDAKTKVYIEMNVSYYDKATGKFSASVPVIWKMHHRFHREIVNKLNACNGDLRNALVRITRNGAKGYRNTSYSLDFVLPGSFSPEVFNPNSVSADFSAFQHCKLNRHSFSDKSVEEIGQFLSTGVFPDNREKSVAPNVVAPNPTVAPNTAPNAGFYQPRPAAQSAPYQTMTNSFGQFTPANNSANTFAEPSNNTVRTSPTERPFPSFTDFVGTNNASTGEASVATTENSTPERTFSIAGFDENDSGIDFPM